MNIRQLIMTLITKQYCWVMLYQVRVYIILGYVRLGQERIVDSSKAFLEMGGKNIKYPKFHIFIWTSSNTLQYLHGVQQILIIPINALLDSTQNSIFHQTSLSISREILVTASLIRFLQVDQVSDFVLSPHNFSLLTRNK